MAGSGSQSQTAAHDNGTMTIFAVLYSYSDDPALGDAHRPEHRAFLATFNDPAGTVVRLAAGPWVGEPAGALIIFKAPDSATLETALNDDPFRREGFLVDRTVREWGTVFGPFDE